MATDNMYRKFSEIWTCYFLDVQVDRHAHQSTTILHPPLDSETK